MKTYLTLTAAALLLATAPLAHAGTKARVKKHTTKTVEAVRIDYTDRVVVNAQASTPMVQDAHGWIGGEIGNNAPHEERNPSDHIELFQADR